MRKYIKDCFISICFWVPLTGLWSYFVINLDIWQTIGTMIGSTIINAVFGGAFGQVLDRWRKVLKYT